MKPTTGVLLINVGTPDSPAVGDVRKYLSQFLNDPRVIDIPWIARKLLVNAIIVPFRAPKSAKLYKQMWTPEGSPLLIHSRNFGVKLQEQLGDDYMVEIAMRYQSPDLASAMADMEAKNLKKLIVIPFFPQYASASTGSVFERVMQLMSKWQVMPSLSIASYFYDHPAFSSYFAAKAANYQKDVNFDYYLFSYHGIPERHVRKGDLTKTTCVFGTCCPI